MKLFRRRIIVKFTDEEDTIRVLNLSGREKDFLTKEQVFEYSRKTKIKDLLNWIYKNINPNKEHCNNLSFYIRGVIDEKQYILIDEFPLYRYIRKNSNDGRIIFTYLTGIGAYSANLENGVCVFMNYNEHKHMFMPHVHVRKGKYLKGNDRDNTIRIRLSDNKILDDRKNDAKRIFDKDLDIVFELLTNNRERFIDNYNLMLRGIKPESAIIDLGDKTIIFEP